MKAESGNNKNASNERPSMTGIDQRAVFGNDSHLKDALLINELS